jgi:hypothetical protein
MMVIAESQVVGLEESVAEARGSLQKAQIEEREKV